MGLRAVCMTYSCKRYSAPDVISSGAYHYRVLVSPRADPTPDQGRVVPRRLLFRCVPRVRVTDSYDQDPDLGLACAIHDGLLRDRGGTSNVAGQSGSGLPGTALGA